MTDYNYDCFKEAAGKLLAAPKSCRTLEGARQRLIRKVDQMYLAHLRRSILPPAQNRIRFRDCAQALRDVLSRRSDIRTGFSVAQVFWDISQGKERDDLQTGFYAELINWINGLQGKALCEYLPLVKIGSRVSGRKAALVRSDNLDVIWESVESQMGRYSDGLSSSSQARRMARKRHIMKVLEGSEQEWDNWGWHLGHLILDAKRLSEVVPLSEAERYAVEQARARRLPFGITPYYASLMDDSASDRDRAIRMQVIPPQDYITHMARYREDREHSCDFMLESDTSPVDLITRRYPGIVILKPYNTCPQICVYCQRNWEIDRPMAPDALASEETLEKALRWIESHRAIREVLVTGGDPMMLSDARLEDLLGRLARIEHIDMIRIGTRTPVTLPMRITEETAAMLERFREPGRRDVAIVTHVEHAYEVTIDTAQAVDRLRRRGIAVYNQQVFTFFVSRRFESAALRMVLRRVGIDPYYTFVPKGKEETALYRVPLARILQEQKEEARLLPGLRRTDEAVFNMPGLGKNYIRARQHRDLLTVMPNGSRVYEFHPWEKNVADCGTYIGHDVPIWDYLRRLEQIGETIEDYDSIWFYF